MKKNMFLLVLLLLNFSAGWAQDKEAESRWSVTPHVGANLWTARYKPMTNDALDRKVGLTAGAELGFRMVPRVSLSVGADYTLQRFSHTANNAVLSNDNDVTIAAGRLNLPLQVGVNVWKGLSLRTGIQMGISLHTNNASIHYSSMVYSAPDGKVKYVFDKTHWYVPIGLTYEYRRWVMDLRYSYSLKRNEWRTKGNNAVSFFETYAKNKGHDTMLQLTLGYRFNL